MSKRITIPIIELIGVSTEMELTLPVLSENIYPLKLTLIYSPFDSCFILFLIIMLLVYVSFQFQILILMSNLQVLDI
jgi:hypothetical protein